MELLLALVLLGLVAYFVFEPLRGRPGAPDAERRRADAELADLEARKEAVYRQIRDAEADRAAGKMAPDAYARADAELRAEAIEILKRIDALRPEARPAPRAPAQPPEAPASPPEAPPGPGPHRRG